jgi:hypothetical protein
MSNLKPAAHDDLVRDLAYALFHDGRQPYRLAKEFVADMTAIHLIEHLEAEGFVFMKKPPIRGHAGDWGWMPEGR